jgi:hypothetical protein
MPYSSSSDQAGWQVLASKSDAVTHGLCCTTQVPALNIFETSFRRGKFDASRKLANGGMLDFTHIYPMDAVFDTPEDVPAEVGEGGLGPTGGSSWGCSPGLGFRGCTPVYVPAEVGQEWALGCSAGAMG